MADRGSIPVLTGCTGSGKTALLLELAEGLRMEVISADSRQIYRGMDIGTAKPTPGERNVLPHHLLDIADPDGRYSAGRFASDARRLVPRIRSRGALPVVAGGTGLYILALAGALDPMPGSDPRLRGILGTMESERPGTLMRHLRAIDPDRAAALHPSDTVRQLRALEVCLLSGRRASSLRRGGTAATRVECRVAALFVERDELRRRISGRTAGMLRNGLIEEVRALRAAGWGRESALGGTIGYREVLDYLDGGIRDMDALGETISVNTWRLARRQANMYRRIAGLRWVRDAGELAGFMKEEGWG